MAKLKLEERQTTQNLYEAVELTPEETAEAILLAKEKKYWRLDAERKLEDQRQAKLEFLRPWAFEEMRDNAAKRADYLVKKSNPRGMYVVDEFVRPVFDLLCLYFTQDERFENAVDAGGRNYSLSKGIMLVGSVGVGKTDLLRAFEKNKRRCFATITANEISEKVKSNGADYWRTYCGFVPGHGNTPEYFLQNNIGWAIDDMGTENKVVDYGTPVDPMQVIIAERYKMKDKIPFNSMHITSNLDGEELERRYDYRLRSRIREMFNVIQLGGKDRR